MFISSSFIFFRICSCSHSQILKKINECKRERSNSCGCCSVCCCCSLVAALLFCCCLLCSHGIISFAVFNSVAILSVVAVFIYLFRVSVLYVTSHARGGRAILIPATKHVWVAAVCLGHYSAASSVAVSVNVPPPVLLRLRTELWHHYTATFFALLTTCVGSHFSSLINDFSRRCFWVLFPKNKTSGSGIAAYCSPRGCCSYCFVEFAYIVIFVHLHKWLQQQGAHVFSQLCYCLAFDTAVTECNTLITVVEHTLEQI